MESTPASACARRSLKIHRLFALAVLPASLTVCPDCEIKSINDAIAKAAPGATITVHGGHYREGQISITKPLTLQGKDFPVLDGNGGDHPIVMVQANGVKISGFTIKDTGVSYTQELAGIRLVESKDCVIENNRFLNTTYAIYLQQSHDCRIMGNEIVGQAKDESSSGNGVHIWYGFRNIIENNRIEGHRDGIYFEFVKDSKVSGNAVRKNVRYGLHFMNSNDSEYLENEFSENGAGVAVMYSKNIVMLRNRFVKNTGAATYGLLLKDINNSKIENNQFLENTVGIYMEGSSRSAYTRNRFQSNGWALRIMGNCDENTFTKNVFSRNSFDVTTNSSYNPNRFSENFWSHYDGYDLNGDGIGDRPFRPVSLSSVIMERADSSFILLNSFLFTLLDEVERALPELIPERLKDERPLMTENGVLK